MFCKNCGRQLSDNESFCPGCGTKRPGGESTIGDGRSSADMKNLPNYAKEDDLHQAGHAVDSDRKQFSLSGQGKFSLSGQSKFSLSDSEKKKFSLSDDSRKDAGDGIVRLSTGREPAAPRKEPTGFVNPLKDSGKTVFRSGDNGNTSAAEPMQAAKTEQPAPPSGPVAQAAPQASAQPENDGPTGFVNPLKGSGQNIQWGSDGDRNETKGGTQFAGDPRDIDSHMGFAIFVTILGCCNCLNLVLGIIAIVFASQVQKHIEEGNYEQAKKSADTARILCWISLVLMLLGFVMSFVTGAISAFLEAFSS